MSSNPSVTNQSAVEPAARPRFDYNEDVPAPALKPGDATGKRDYTFLIAAAILFCVSFGYLYFWNLSFLVSTWKNDSAWSHGFAVPLLSAYLIGRRWDELKKLDVQPAWPGLIIVLVAVVGQIFFHATGTTHMENLSMLVVIMGTVLFVLGWDFMRILWLPIAYLVFAINWPSEIYQRVTEPMQRISATLSAKFLVVMSIDAKASGVQLSVNDKPVNVAEACAGMKMLVAFIALAAVLAYSSNRPLWQKVFLTLCAIPVAVVCNIIRVSIIAFLVANDPAKDSNWAHGDAHGFVGLAMLGPAMLMQFGIGWVLDRIFVDEPAPAGEAKT